MGYESRIHIAKHTTVFDDKKEKTWAQIISTMEMGKDIPLSRKFTEESSHYIFVDDEETSRMDRNDICFPFDYDDIEDYDYDSDPIWNEYSKPVDDSDFEI